MLETRKNGRKQKEMKAEQEELAIVPVESMEIYALSQEEADEMNDIPITLPRMKFDGRKGKFTFTADDTTVSAIRVAILGHKYNHVMFNEYGSDGPSWVCRSSDAVNGQINPELTDAEVRNLMDGGAGKECVSCQFLQWHKGEKPKCSKGLNLLCVDLDTHIPYVLTAARSSLKGIESYLSAFRLNKTKTYAAATSIESERKTDSKGKMEWYVLKPRREEMLTPEMVVELSQYKMILGKTFNDTNQVIAEEAPEEAKPVSDSPYIPPQEEDSPF